MDEEQLKERKRFLTQEARKREKVSKMRKEAVGKRSDRQPTNGEGGEENVDGNADKKSTESVDQAPSPATVKRLKSSFLKLLPVALDYQFGVLRRLVIDLDVDALIVSPGSSMTETMDRSTIYRYRYSIKDYLESILKRYRIQPSKFLLC